MRGEVIKTLTNDTFPLRRPPPGEMVAGDTGGKWADIANHGRQQTMIGYQI